MIERTRRSSLIILYDPKTMEYLSMDGLERTKDRFWAWTGNVRQMNRCLEVFPAAEGMHGYRDGDENV